MSTIKYVGRTTDFRGNTLWDILSNLKNFGVGRVVVRSMFERYPEKSFCRILKVEAMPSPLPEAQTQRKCTVWVEKVFRGQKYPSPSKIDSAAYKKDYRLLSKKEEAEYCQLTERPVRIIDPSMDLPPLLKVFVMKETGQANPKMKVHWTQVKKSPFNTARIAKDGEKPNFEIPLGVGEPHPEGKNLYEGIKL